MATLNQMSFPEAETFDCPKCRETITLYDPSGSEFCTCTSCKSFIRFIANNTPKIQKDVQPIKNKPVIPLGTTGTIKGTPFKVIAYLEKRERDTIYCWREYLLYNYEKGYAILAEFNGHWNFIVDKTWEPSLEKAYSDSVTATLDQIDYRIFNKYTPVTTALVGELDWDVFADTPKTYEYIAPPYSITRESGGSGSKHAEYFLGEYLEPDEIAASFGLDIDTLPFRDGIGANQPSPHFVQYDTLTKYTILAILGMLLLHLVIKIYKPERELVNSYYNITFDKPPGSDSTAVTPWISASYEFKPFLTSSFEQPDDSAPLEVFVGSNVNNNWLEATVILVNEETNETWEVTKGIEYYHGYEDGASWSEGSQETSIILSEVPKGKYHLNIYPSSGNPYQASMHIRILSNITLWRNILLTVVVLCLFPVYCWYRMRSFEKRRWMNSDHSPYETED